jgi:SAM-dependent methyltransferase
MASYSQKIKSLIETNQNIYKLALYTRGKLVRFWNPANKYMKKINLKPLSSKFGFDRGMPIDRYWIEDFLYKNSNLIKGHCLEIGDSSYTKMFGKRKVSKTDVLDIDIKNPKANIYGDIRNLKKLIEDESYDCIILTHVLGLIDDPSKAVSEIYRILKKDGVVLATSACFSPTYKEAKNFWRILPEGANYIFGKYFGPENVEVTSYGNVLAGRAFWVGMSQEDLAKEDLRYNDSRFPCVTCALARKR